MKYFHCPISQTMGIKAQECGISVTCKNAASLKPLRSVHFPNDIVFLDYVRQGELERIGQFIRAGRVNLDTIYHTGMAAMHEAVLSGNLECVKLLVNYGANVHQRDEEGWTPLHMACSDGFPHIARYLLELGADPELENDCGEKPSDLIDLDNRELLELFGLAIND
ncbi:protein phosphatase 1 regulatory subunit 27b [Pungitius pungitius]|uniref:protein phosphatase 1 regulatory subunit 27b n=1 Tax=Pungitius pungitius TaxID=134920 RepID=UPI001886ECE1|nr:protein phosphatase 1 regulatory subunit 27b [Pungitius pungitius]